MNTSGSTKTVADDPFEPREPEQVEAIARQLLERPFWLPSVKQMTNYSIVHDDHDGTHQGSLAVTMGNDADAWVSAHNPNGYGLRFRTYLGGGRNVRVRNALLLLALAIKLDTEEPLR